jgi:magnesium chelatase family protein
MTTRDLRRHCALTEGVEQLLRDAVNRFGLSARGYHRILKIARTIADLAGADELASTHVREAIQYRSLDRQDRGVGQFPRLPERAGSTA